MRLNRLTMASLCHTIFRFRSVRVFLYAFDLFAQAVRD